MASLNSFEEDGYFLTDNNVQFQLSQDEQGLKENNNTQNMDRVYPLRIGLDIFFCALVIVPIAVLNFSIEPYHRGFYCNDDTIRYPYKLSTVSTACLLSAFLAIPIITIFLMEAFRTFYFEPKVLGQTASHRPFTKKLHCHPYVIRLYYYLGFFIFGAFICQSITDICKFTVGRLRPHFIAVCIPEWDKLECKNYAYLTQTDCRGDEKLVREARLSFPSGHSSFSFYTMTFSVLYLQSQFIWPLTSRLIKSVVQFVYICLALLTALSRISDYQHHWSDVLAGSLLGITVASIVCTYFVGLFRHPKQQVFVNGIVASDISSARKILSEQRLNNSSADSQTTLATDS